MAYVELLCCHALPTDTYDQALKAKPAYNTSSSSSQAVNTAVQQGSKCVHPAALWHRLRSDSSHSMMYFVPLAMLGAYFAWRYYSNGSL